MLRAKKVERWKKIDDIKNEGSPNDGKYFGKSGGAWSYYPEGYKSGYGSPWKKQQKKEQENTNPENPNEEEGT